MFDLRPVARLPKRDWYRLLLWLPLLLLLLLKILLPLVCYIYSRMEFVNTSYTINILNTYFRLSPFILLTLTELSHKSFAPVECSWWQLFLLDWPVECCRWQLLLRMEWEWQKETKRKERKREREGDKEISKIGRRDEEKMRKSNENVLKFFGRQTIDLFFSWKLCI